MHVFVLQEEEYEVFQSGGNSSGEEMALLLPNHRTTILRYTIYTHRAHKIFIIMS